MHITLLGATGHTGRLIAGLMSEAGQSIRLAGRDLEQLCELGDLLNIETSPIRVDVADEKSLAAAVEGTSVLINCAGPFTSLGLPVIDLCVANGIDYIDITGEQFFISRAVLDFAKPAKQSKCAAVTSCAFEYAIADAAADQLEQALGSLEELEVTYIIDGMHTSRGTKKSVLCALASPALHLIDGKAERIAPGQLGEPIPGVPCRFPFPGGEVFMTPLHSSVHTIRTYLASRSPEPVLRFLSRSAPALAKSPMRGLLERLIEATSKTVEKHTETQFTIVCQGRAGERRATIEIEGHDPYTVTALIAARVARELHERRVDEDDERIFGVLTAAMAIGSASIKELLEEHQVVWRVAKAFD